MKCFCDPDHAFKACGTRACLILTDSQILSRFSPYNQGMEKKHSKKRKNIVGTQIRAARLAEKPPATQLDISARLAQYDVYLTDSSVSRIESGARPVTDIQIIAFAKVLGVSVSWLFQE